MRTNKPTDRVNIEKSVFGRLEGREAAKSATNGKLGSTTKLERSDWE